jgi:hypothetical protein
MVGWTVVSLVEMKADVSAAWLVRRMVVLKELPWAVAMERYLAACLAE